MVPGANRLGTRFWFHKLPAQEDLGDVRDIIIRVPAVRTYLNSRDICGSVRAAWVLGRGRVCAYVRWGASGKLSHDRVYIRPIVPLLARSSI